MKFEESEKPVKVSTGMATDQDIWKAIEEIQEQGKTINLFLPDTLANAKLFWNGFNCQHCGCCCQGNTLLVEDGILISEEETISLANLLKISKHQFKDRYTITKEGQRLMKYPCPFYNLPSRTCNIYLHRPFVCRSYPINITTIEQNPGHYLDGRPLLTASSSCPESRRVAFEILKRSRDRAAASGKP